MKIGFQISNCEFRIGERKRAASFPFDIRRSTFGVRSAFTLIEVLVVVTLLAFIVIALMAVFNSTQTAFRASVTQSDVLEGGRAVMDLMAEDLKAMSPSLGYSNGAVNFYANNNQFQFQSQSAPLIQSLVASTYLRTNVLENFFVLSRENQTWTGVGYVVDTTSANTINPLYRFSMSTNVATSNPGSLFDHFTNDVATSAFTNMSHLIDGVVGLRVRAYDTNGVWINRSWQTFVNTNGNNIFLFPASPLGETGFYMFSNTLPASVEVEMATLEDRTLQRAGSLGGFSQSNYLSQQAGKVHVFRQRVSIPNVDPAAYQ